MRKVVRFLGLCTLIALVFSSCKKSETNSFTASISQPTISSKTYVAENGSIGLYWHSGESNRDTIAVFNHEATPRRVNFYVKSANGSTATFHVFDGYSDFMSNISVDSSYTAFYPNVVFEDALVKLPVASELPFKEARTIWKNTYPMYASNVGSNFDFHSNAGFLYVQFSVNVDAHPGISRTFDRVVLESSDANDKLTGYMTYNCEGKNYQFVGNGNSITLNCASPVVLDENKTLSSCVFILPEGALWSGFTLTLYNGTNLVCQKTAPAFDPAQLYSNVIVAQTFTDMPMFEIN